MITQVHIDQNNSEGRKYENANHSITLVMESKQEAEFISGLFPKYCKAKVSTISGYSNGESYNRPIVSLNVSTYTDDITGDVNEAGEKRRNKTLEILTAIELLGNVYETHCKES